MFTAGRLEEKEGTPDPFVDKNPDVTEFVNPVTLGAV
jgi:hypothetical protein